MATIQVKGKACTSFAGSTAHSGMAVMGSSFEGNSSLKVVCRYSFTTDAYGASAISFRTNDASCDVRGSSNSDESVGRMRFAFGTDPQGYVNYMGNAGSAITSYRYGQYVEGSLQADFRPNTSYYLWIYPASNFHGMTRFHLGGCSISTSGSYGTASSISAPNGSFGSGIPVTLSNSVNGVTNTLTVSCAGISETLLSDSSAASVTWTPSLSRYGPAIPNSRVASATLSCTTSYQGAVWGSSSKTILISVPDSAAPTISQVSLSPCNTGSAASALSLYVQGYSKARALIAAAGKYGADIADYSLSIEGSTVSGASSTLTSAVLGGAGSLTATVKVTDSRGLSSSCTRSFTVQPYSRPVLSRVSLTRCDSGGTASETGTYLRAFAQGSVAALGGQNSMSMSVSFRPVNGSYGAETPMTSGTQTLLSGLNVDVTYVARITLSDRLGNSAVATDTVSSRKWAMKFNARGTAVGFGKAPEADKVLEIPADWRIMREQLFAVFYPVGAIYLSTSSVNPGTLFGGTWERITGRFLLGATDNGADGGDSSAGIKPGGAGGKACQSYTPGGSVQPHALSVEEMPAHFHKMQYKANGGSYDGGYVWDAPGKLTSYTESGAGMASTGGGQGHAHGFSGTTASIPTMPPYLAVYIWKRVS